MVSYSFHPPSKRAFIQTFPSFFAQVFELVKKSRLGSLQLGITQYRALGRLLSLINHAIVILGVSLWAVVSRRIFLVDDVTAVTNEMHCHHDVTTYGTWWVTILCRPYCTTNLCADIAHGCVWAAGELSFDTDSRSPIWLFKCSTVLTLPLKGTFKWLISFHFRWGHFLSSLLSLMYCIYFCTMTSTSTFFSFKEYAWRT